MTRATSSLNRRDTTLTAAQRHPVSSRVVPNFNAIFQRANRGLRPHCDPVGHAGWVGRRCSGAAIRWIIRSVTRVASRIYSFDLKGYGTLQFPQERVYCLAGWNDRCSRSCRKLDHDPEALVREVEAVPLED